MLGWWAIGLWERRDTIEAVPGVVNVEKKEGEKKETGLRKKTYLWGRK